MWRKSAGKSVVHSARRAQKAVGKLLTDSANAVKEQSYCLLQSTDSLLQSRLYFFML
jgi:hypothetical protein